MIKKSQIYFRTGIVFGATGNMAFALGNVLIGLKKHSPDLKTDLIVYEQGISDKDKNILNSILPCDCRKYKFPYPGYLANETLNKFSELTFARFECFNLLDEYKKVLWLDIDTLIKSDISGLFNCKLSPNMRKSITRSEKNDKNLSNSPL